jgi:hypothetical protein
VPEQARGGRVSMKFIWKCGRIAPALQQTSSWCSRTSEPKSCWSNFNKNLRYAKDTRPPSPVHRCRAPGATLGTTSRLARMRDGADASADAPHRDSLPTFIQPQLSLLMKTPPSAPGWAHEHLADRVPRHLEIPCDLLDRLALDETSPGATASNQADRRIGVSRLNQSCVQHQVTSE